MFAILAVILIWFPPLTNVQLYELGLANVEAADPYKYLLFCLTQRPSTLAIVTVGDPITGLLSGNWNVTSLPEFVGAEDI